VRALDIGAAADLILSEAACGRVLAVHRKAIYLRLPGGLCALTSRLAPPGPLHLRLEALPHCRAGDRIRTDGRTVGGADWAVSLTARRWFGTTPAVAMLAAAINPTQVPEEAARLGGRGPGLTPAGDDVLAGLLLVARARAGIDSEPTLLAAVSAARTGDIAAGFLTWAARGQCIAPAHDVLHALVRHGADAAVPACARLAAIGASSGTALLTGIRAGLAWNSDRPRPELSTIINVHLRS
jgi:hypothetical protein